MKARWEIQRLKDACDIDRVQGMHSGLPYVGLEDIESHTARFLGSDLPTSVKSTTFRFSREHVLYGRLRPYLNKVLAPEFEGHCSTEIFPLKPRSGVTRKFLLYWLLRDETVSHANDTARGTRMPRADVEEILNFEFPIPPLPEQRRIVGILDEAFEKIATARENAEKGLAGAREVFESHLRWRFSSNLDWEETTIGDELELQRGFDITKSQQITGEIPVVSSGGISSTHNEARATAPGIVIGRKGTLGKVFYLEKDFWPHDTTLWVRDFKGNAPKLAYYLFSQLDVRQLNSGSTNPALNRNRVHPIRIRWPRNRQAEIVASLEDFEAKIVAIEALYTRKLAALDELKKSLLHHAFTGAL